MTRIDARGELDLIFKHAATSGRPLTIYIQDDGFGQSYAQYLDELSKKYTFPLGEKILFKPASLAEKPEASRYADLTR